MAKDCRPAVLASSRGQHSQLRRKNLDSVEMCLKYSSSVQLVPSTVLRHRLYQPLRQASHAVTSEVAVGCVPPEPFTLTRVAGSCSTQRSTVLRWAPNSSFHSSELLLCRRTPRHVSPTHENGQNKLVLLVTLNSLPTSHLMA